MPKQADEPRRAGDIWSAREVVEEAGIDCAKMSVASLRGPGRFPCLKPSFDSLHYGHDRPLAELRHGPKTFLKLEIS